MKVWISGNLSDTGLSSDYSGTTIGEKTMVVTLIELIEYNIDRDDTGNK